MGKLQTLVVDNGGSSVRYGLVTADEPRISPNYIVKSKLERKRVYVGEEFDECTERSALYFLLPFEKGYLVNYDVQQQVWSRIFSKYTPHETRIAITDPNCLIPALRDESVEILFEDFGFHSVNKTSASGFVSLGDLKDDKRCSLVVDSGYSFTTVAPFVDGRPIQEGILRIDIGGKALTNQLKEWVSYREMDVREETYVMNQCKEDACYVSLDFDADMRIAQKKGDQNTIRREYILPDFVELHKGIVRDPFKKREPHEMNYQSLKLNVERFALPEALFRPSDIGLTQMGVVDAVIYSVRKCPENVRAALLRNISLVGGSTKFPGFKERFERDIRSAVLSEWGIELADVKEPQTHAWQRARHAFFDHTYDEAFVTRADYFEKGHVDYKKRFISFL